MLETGKTVHFEIRLAADNGDIGRVGDSGEEVRYEPSVPTDLQSRHIVYPLAFPERLLFERAANRSYLVTNLLPLCQISRDTGFPSIAPTETIVVRCCSIDECPDCTRVFDRPEREVVSTSNFERN